jgi:prephenate dehydrogenase
MSQDTNRPATVIIVGVLGSIGRFIATRFAETKGTVIGIDISEPTSNLVLKNIAFRSENILALSNATITDLARANTVIFAVPYQVMAEAIGGILQHIRSDCLLVDTLSTKTPFLTLIEDYKISQQSVGINPMFSGDLNPQGRPLVAVTYKNGKAVENFLAVIKTWDLRIIPLGAVEHDQVMAVLQSLGHAVLIAFGKVLVDTRIDPFLMDALAPPPFRLLLTLIARITQNHPDVYWEIQANNPYARQYRDLLQKSLNELETTISIENKSAFKAGIDSFGSSIINELPEYLQLSRKVFEFIHQNSNSSSQCLKEIS